MWLPFPQTFWLLAPFILLASSCCPGSLVPSPLPTRPVVSTLNSSTSICAFHFFYNELSPPPDLEAAMASPSLFTSFFHLDPSWVPQSHQPCLISETLDYLALILAVVLVRKGGIRVTTVLGSFSHFDLSWSHLGRGQLRNSIRLACGLVCGGIFLISV